MRILVLGSGAKDTAAAWWLSQSAFISALYVAPGNPGTEDIAINLPATNPASPEEVYRAIIEHRIDGVFIGTEAPLLSGVMEYLKERGILCFGATKEALRLEDDKAFSRAFTSRHNIPVPGNAFFRDMESLEKYLDEHEGVRYTIKSNSITPSRIMLSSADREAILNYASTLLQKGPVLLESYVEGLHATATLFLDGNGYLLLPLANEYTNVSHSQGTPTGGMGAVAPIPLREHVLDDIKKKIIEPTLRGMKEEGLSYRGVLTLSIIISSNGPVLVDYHVRLNDPATQAMVPIIKTDVIEILTAMKENRVRDVKLELNDQCTVAVVLAAKGYPLNPEKGIEIDGITNAFMMNSSDKPLVFIGAIERRDDGRCYTSGGRCITVVGRGSTIEEANEQAYALIKEKYFPMLWYRDDIGNKFFSQ